VSTKPGELHRRGPRGAPSFGGRRAYVHADRADCLALRALRRGSGLATGAARSTAGPAWAGIAFVGAVELSVRQVLEAVAHLEEASLQLVCWELNVQEGEARPAFERAIADGLLARCGVDELYNEVMYALTDAGRRALEGAR
jgi:hypothetical protein